MNMIQGKWHKTSKCSKCGDIKFANTNLYPEIEMSLSDKLAIHNGYITRSKFPCNKCSNEEKRIINLTPDGILKVFNEQII